MNDGTGIALDFETSGYGADSACAVGMARLDEGRVADRFYALIRPPSSFVRFTEVHGLTWPMLKDAPTFAELWPQMAAFLQGAAWFVAHNASFDRRVLIGCCRAAGIAEPRLPFYCTLKGSRRSLPLPSHRLSSVCEHFQLPLQHHHAGSDAEACAEIYLRLRALGVSQAQMKA